MHPPAADADDMRPACMQAGGDAAAMQRGGHIGLWLHFSLINHSCLPNAINFVVGDHMVVTATRALRQVGRLPLATWPACM